MLEDEHSLSCRLRSEAGTVSRNMVDPHDRTFALIAIAKAALAPRVTDNVPRT